MFDRSPTCKMHARLQLARSRLQNTQTVQRNAYEELEAWYLKHASDWTGFGVELSMKVSGFIFAPHCLLFVGLCLLCYFCFLFKNRLSHLCKSAKNEECCCSVCHLRAILMYVNLLLSFSIHGPQRRQMTERFKFSNALTIL